ncbi:MAG: c-type cytochrome [Pirellulales bacterium]
MDHLLRLLAVASCLQCVVFASFTRAAEPGIKAPEGFEVTKFAGDDLAHDIFSITTDATGRIAVSGPGYVKILEDRNGDGVADHAHQFAQIRSGALGMYFDGSDLIYTGDNKVARLRDTDGDRVGDTEEVWTQLGHAEHGTHHIVKGPDGWYYIASGNDAGVSQKHATTPNSPIKDPVCGAILRFSPDGKQSEIVADGFRNMCGLDFNSAGHLFTVDSDNERDQHLPWYCPTRLFDVAIGQSHGWLQRGWQQGWNRPQYFFDSVERLVEIGRGSPTGVVVCRHRAWPQRYRDGVFSACWSMGRIYFCPLTAHGATYASNLETFLEGDGATGLAIVGMTVDPAGDMYFAVGGRRTQGSVFRVRYTGPRDEPSADEQTHVKALRANLGAKLYDVLTADQPLSNWSRVEWEPAAREIGKERFARITADQILPASLRQRALEILADRFNGVESPIADSSRRAKDRQVDARLTYVRRLQIAAGDVPHWTAKPEVFCGYSSASPRRLAGEDLDFVSRMAKEFPHENAALNRELARLFAMLKLDNAALPLRLVSRCTDQSTLEDDIHYLIVLARLPTSRSAEVTQSTARALVLLHHKLGARGGIASRNWPLRVGELFQELCKKDSLLAEALIDDKEFGLPGHALFVSKLTGDMQVRAARKLRAAVNKGGAEWDTDLIAALAVLPRDELRSDLHERFEEPALRDSIALVIAASAVEDDRALLIDALSSVQPNVVQSVAEGLAKLDTMATAIEIAAALNALRRQTLAPNEKQTRQALVGVLKQWTEQKIEVEETKGTNLGAAYSPWFEWFAAEHPGEAKKLTGFAGDLASWQKRLAAIDWSTGDAVAGKAVFEKRSCHRCHAVSGRLGPDLAGAATRFSREDLFAAIVDPNKEVAPLYQTTEVVTDDGQVYNGLVVYESPDTTMLQTGPDTVIRVGGVRKDGMRKSNASLMPVGLLNDARDRELADLYAYLKTLSK